MATVRTLRTLPLDAEITAEEAAGLLGYSRREIYRRLQDGVVPGHKVGNRWYCWRADVDRLLAEGTAQAPATLSPADALGLLAALAGDGEVTFEVTIRRKSKTA